jgi:hypothetical protein
MGPFDLWPLAVLALLLGYVLGATLESQSLSLILRRRGTVRFILCSIAVLLIVGAFTAFTYVLIVAIASIHWNDAAKVAVRMTSIVLGFGLLVISSTWCTTVLVKYFAAHSWRRITVKIQD